MTTPNDYLQYGALGLAFFCLFVVLPIVVVMVRWMMRRLDVRYNDVISLTKNFEDMAMKFDVTTANFSVVVGNHLDHQEERFRLMMEYQENIAETLERACVSHNDTVAALNRLCALWGNGG